jgi:DNA-binding IclR family transcriptional regulator
VLEALTARPAERWTLTRLADVTGATRATTHAVLGTLVARGWVEKDAGTKTYGIGPALRLLARDLDAARPLEQAARDAAAKLAAEHGWTAVVVRLVDDAVVVSDVLAAPGRSSAIKAGSRVPNVAPFGPAFAAWADEDEQQRWIATGDAVNAALGARLRTVLPAIRRRGYSLERSDAPSAAAFAVLGQLQQDVFGDAVREVLGRVLAELTRVDFLPTELRGRHEVTSIAAPVFDATGRVVLNLSLHPHGVIAAADLRALGESVAAAADTVTRDTGGLRP